MLYLFRLLEFLRKFFLHSEEVILYRSNNPLLSHLLVEFLRENQVAAYLSQEAVGQYAYPVHLGKLSEIEIIVSKQDFPRAKQYLEIFLAQAETNGEEGDHSY
ncbi:MAG: hypothetical protein RML93_12835 [Anaerolineales bacterium]|nr:hypothetical protein [Anaerolineales bacterium]MCS7246878.1 hypothetical protein [Anaerolineales bacterium]MDW8160689.1 hypothetical protein [Anaerolineales bacterium]MDW8448161.1 hypothetical protein [Anaerolineales bacterium]